MRNINAAVGVSLVEIYAVGSGIWVNTGDNWYREPNSPSWQPPNWVFGVFWPNNFIVLGWAAVKVAQSATTSINITYLYFFGLSVICAPFLGLSVLSSPKLGGRFLGSYFGCNFDLARFGYNF